MTDSLSFWVLIFLALAFVAGAVLNGVRFVTRGGRPAHAIGLALMGALAVVVGWVASIAATALSGSNTP